MMKWLREHSLGLVMFGLFFVFLFGQSMMGLSHNNQERFEHGQEELKYGQYVMSGEFMESVFENWESEFLQMGSFVLLTTFLYQKGSAESKKLNGEEKVDRKPKKSVSADAPEPVRKGGWMLKVYENSLGLAFVLLFLVSFWAHAHSGAVAACEESQIHGSQEQCEGTYKYLTTSQFWFESFQNWQSEFLAVGSMVVLSIYLRQRGSPESKPVSAPHYQTGTE